MWIIHAREYYSAVKRNGVLIDAATRENLEDIVLNESGQTHMLTCCLIPFIGDVQNRQIYGDRLAGGGVGGGWEQSGK